MMFIAAVLLVGSSLQMAAAFTSGMKSARSSFHVRMADIVDTVRNSPLHLPSRNTYLLTDL